MAIMAAGTAKEALPDGVALVLPSNNNNSVSDLDASQGY